MYFDACIPSFMDQCMNKNTCINTECINKEQSTAPGVFSPKYTTHSAAYVYFVLIYLCMYVFTFSKY